MDVQALPVRYIDLMTVCRQHNLSPQVINMMWLLRRRRKEKDTTLPFVPPEKGEVV